MKRVLLYGTIVFATLCLASGVYFYRIYLERKWYQIAGVPIQIIAQTGPEKEALKTDYLAELIGLSCDQEPAMIKERKAQERLLTSPVIQKAEVKRIALGILSIDYSLRKPYVFLGEFENTALDREGYPFPFSPFYTPKNMPRVFLGSKSIHWGVPVEKRSLAFEVLSYLENEIDLFKVETLDITCADHSSLGRREIILVIRENSGQHTLRLSPANYREELGRYLLLDCEKRDWIIDLRLPKLAFIKRKSRD